MEGVPGNLECRLLCYKNYPNVTSDPLLMQDHYSFQHCPYIIKHMQFCSDMTVIELSSIEKPFCHFRKSPIYSLERNQLRYTVNLACPQESRTYFETEGQNSGTQGCHRGTLRDSSLGLGTRPQTGNVGFRIITSRIVLFAVFWDKKIEQVALKRRHTVHECMAMRLEQAATFTDTFP